MAKVVNKKAVEASNKTTPTLRNGSSGSDVKTLQKALINAGYDVGSSGADGIYGSKTAAAVKAYQKANGLAVDGIAGNQTLGHLYSNKGKTPTTTPTTPTPPAATAPKAPASNKTTPSATTQTGASTTPTTTASAPDTPAESKPSAQSNDSKTETKPFTYEDFSYDKQFSYGDFSYGDFTYGDYTESETVKQANALLQQQNANKPGAYQSQWQDEISDYLNRIENRDPFSYDVNQDALYQQYKDNYIQQGQMAMMDAMGQAQAMTGGYGSSYAQTVGQQAYNQQLNQLNNVVPELYQMAHDRYAYEGQQLQDMYNMYLGLENQDYGRYMDSLNAWAAERDYLANRYDSERDYDYGMWESNRNFAYDQYSADRNLAYDQWSSGRELAYDEYVADRNLAYDQWSSNRNLAYDEYRAGIQDAQWQAQFDAEDARWQAEFDEDKRRYEQNRTDAQAAAAAKASSGSGTGTKKTSYTSVSLEDQATIQKNFERAGSLEAAKSYAKTLELMGYNPEIIAAISSPYISKYSSGETIDTTVDDPLAKRQEEIRNNKKYVGGGGGVQTVVNRFTY